ncbi:MAG: IS30 family transposase [Clostridiales bacterium]|nr:IS30 family transposase [Clostridiales bacterium]
MPNQKHLTFDERSFIQNGLNSGYSFRCIGSQIGKDPTTVSKEVRRHRVLHNVGAYGRITNRCIHKGNCTVQGLCDSLQCKRSYCRSCKKCNELCSDYQEEHCLFLAQPPYVCNGCKHRSRCVLTKYLYAAVTAHKNYLDTLSSSREGFSYTEEEIQAIDEVIAPLVKKKQSIHHIYVSQTDRLFCSERTIYNLVDQCVLTVRNIDLPRKVRYRPRRRSKPFKVDRNCLKGRSYQDYLAFLQEHPDTPIVQMDTVEGRKGGKVFLTIFFTQADLLLIFLRDRNTSQSVIDVFSTLEQTLGVETFRRLFPVILTDNGTEFSNPAAIETDANGCQRTRLFYCEPSSPYQKAEIERSHEFIRMVLPKGTSFDHLTQDRVYLLACHINSLIRKKLNDRSPATAFSFFHGAQVLRDLNITVIPPEEVTLSTALLTACKEVPVSDGENL